MFVKFFTLQKITGSFYTLLISCLLISLFACSSNKTDRHQGIYRQQLDNRQYGNSYPSPRRTGNNYNNQPYTAPPSYGRYSGHNQHSNNNQQYRYGYPPASRQYNNPYSFPPPNQYPYYDGDHHYVPPTYYGSHDNRTSAFSSDKF